MNQVENRIVAKCAEFDITEPLELAHFLAQCNHESGGFMKMSEGANYRYKRAKEIWPSRIAIIEEKQKAQGATDQGFISQPWLFNTVYNGRMGNRLNTNDGFMYRGGGFIELTGRHNYQDFCTWLNNDNYNVENITAYVRTEDGAILSAIWFWVSKNIKPLALADNILEITKRINGGANGLLERKTLLLKYKQLLDI